MVRPQRILLAEDDDDLRALLLEVLTGEGHDVVAVADVAGLETTLLHALWDRASGERRFDLLLTDLHMPGEEIFGVLERLGNAGLRPPTVLLSAFTDDETLVAAYRIGCLCALSKPFDLRDLVRLVELLSRRPPVVESG